jgi:hypothetical protein
VVGRDQKIARFHETLLIALLSVYLTPYVGFHNFVTLIYHLSCLVLSCHCCSSILSRAQQDVFEMDEILEKEHNKSRNEKLIKDGNLGKK